MLNKLQVHAVAWWAGRGARKQADEARAQPMDTGIGAEAAIRTISEDHLRRADFTGGIAAVPSELTPREGRVFAIHGGWGFGVSSIKNLITERLDTNEGVDWLDFSPCNAATPTITHTLFSQIAARLGAILRVPLPARRRCDVTARF